MNYSSRAFIFVLIFSFVNSQFDVNCSQPEKNYTITYNDLDHYYGDVGIGCNGYSNNVLYNWTMTLPKEFNIILMWSFINTQLDHDYVTVYNSNGEQISHISGSPIGINQSTLDANGNEITVVFSSDSSGTSQGFSALLIKEIAAPSKTPSVSPTPSITPSPIPNSGNFICCFYFSTLQQFESSFCQKNSFYCPNISGFYPVGNTTVSNCMNCNISSQ